MAGLSWLGHASANASAKWPTFVVAATASLSPVTEWGIA